MRMVVEVEGLAEAIAGLVAAAEVSPELRSEVADILREDLLSQFQAGGRPKWAPLKRATVRGKRSMGYPRLTRHGTAPARLVQEGSFGPENVLIRTGALLSSWTDPSDPHHVERAEGEEIVVGSAIAYAAYHQEGRGVPQRALKVSDRAVEAISSLVGERLQEATG